MNTIQLVNSANNLLYAVNDNYNENSFDDFQSMNLNCNNTNQCETIVIFPNGFANFLKSSIAGEFLLKKQNLNNSDRNQLIKIIGSYLLNTFKGKRYVILFYD